jgi:hypothetical protein
LQEVVLQKIAVFYQAAWELGEDGKLRIFCEVQSALNGPWFVQSGPQ